MTLATRTIRILQHSPRETGEIVVEAVHHLGNVELALGNLVEAKRLYREMLRLCEGWKLSYAWLPP